MAKLPGNEQLRDARGGALSSLHEINSLSTAEKEQLYGRLVPERLYRMLGISPLTFCGRGGERLIRFIAPEGLGILRIEVRKNAGDKDTVFFLELTDTQFRQMELALCVINDPEAERFNVDVDEAGNETCFGTVGRNIPEELRAMRAGLFPNQTRRGLKLFADFFWPFERFVDALGMDMIVAEPLTYDNAIRYEGFGFDYVTGRRLMREINHEFRPGGILFEKLDGSSPFRMPGMQLTSRGRSWAIHDGILDEPWDDELSINTILDEPWNDVSIYKMVGVDAGINTFPEREREE